MLSKLIEFFMNLSAKSNEPVEFFYFILEKNN